jgi:translation elongation factor EF-4
VGRVYEFFFLGMKATPSLLEPIMTLEITIDEQYVGTVLSDLTKRRGMFVLPLSLLQKLLISLYFFYYFSVAINLCQFLSPSFRLY